GHPVRLGDQRHRDPLRAYALAHRDQVRGVHATTRTVPQHEQAAQLPRGHGQIGSRGPPPRLDVGHPPTIAPTAPPPPPKPPPARPRPPTAPPVRRNPPVAGTGVPAARSSEPADVPAGRGAGAKP